jgi:hypothetical protein
MIKEKKGWTWRNEELSLKEFYKLTPTTRNEYVSILEKLSSTERSSCDDIILNQYSKVITQNKQFLSLDDLD